MLFHTFLFFSYAALNTSAMSAIKTGTQKLPNRRTALGWFGLGGILYAGAIAILLLLLRLGAASTVFPIAIGCTVLATNAAGLRFYGERFTLKKLGGTLLVLLGIVLTFFDGTPT